MLWISSVMAAALGQVRIKVRNCVIAVAAREVCTVVKAPIIREHILQSSRKRLAKIMPRHSLRHPYGVPKDGLGHVQQGLRWSSMGTLSVREIPSQHERPGLRSIGTCGKCDYKAR